MKIELISYTPNPLGVIAFAKNCMRANPKRPDEYTREELEKEFIDCTKSALFGPFEFANFVFYDTDVTRAYTHQKVRTRMATYMQESMRFSAKVGEQFKYLIPESVKRFKDPGKSIYFDGVYNIYENAMKNSQEYYEKLINAKVPVEDARGVLPTNIFTAISSGVDYHTLINIAEQRLCHNTQGEHREATLEMKKLVTEVEPLMGNFLQPSCGHTGICSWEGSLDRPCPLQKIYPFKSEVVKYHKEIKKFLEGMNGR